MIESNKMPLKKLNLLTFFKKYDSSSVLLKLGFMGLGANNQQYLYLRQYILYKYINHCIQLKVREKLHLINFNLMTLN